MTIKPKSISSVASKMTSFSPHRSYVFLCLSCIFTVGISFFIFTEIRSLFKESLQERVQAIVRTAVLQLKTGDLDKIKDESSIHTMVYKKVVMQLQAIKAQNPQIRFADIYRRTEDPRLFEYVADSNSIRPDILVDDNNDGVINEMDEAIFPGEIYEAVSESFIENAFIKNDVAEELEQSQWGYTLDASSPIFDGKNKTDYALNVSVDVTEFIRETNMAFLPFALFVITIILNLILLTLSLVKLWTSRVEAMAELDRQKDELLGIVAHQLGKPITAIRWNLESLLDGDIGELQPQQKEEAKTMHDMAVNLADLTSMILDVSRIQLGKMNLSPQPLDMNAFFAEILEVVKPTIEQKKLKFVKNMPTKLPTVLLDKRYTRMTIENLLTNAVKYTPEGGVVTLDIQIRNGVMYGKVADTGCGIPKAEQDKIFGKMFRASNVRNAQEGNGFGLYVAKGAIEGQGGKIWFESTEGKGTTFYFELPMKEQSAKA